jgi:hypothetical protein
VFLGSGGAITPNTMNILRTLGVSGKDLKTIVMNVLRSSIEMCNIFLDN